MSVEHISWVLRHSVAEHGARLVMFVLADKANDEHHAYPSVATIAREAKLSPRAVQTALKKLVVDGELELLDQPSQYGTKVYRLPDPWGTQNMHPPQNGAATAQNSTSNVSQTAPDPTPNPSDNPLSPEVVWAHYDEVIVKPRGMRRTLDATNRRIIGMALKIRDVEDLCRAIDGLDVSPHHNGENDRGTKYLDLRYALRGNGQRGESNAERIDRMATLASDTVGNVNGTNLRHSTTDRSQYDAAIEDS